MAYPQTCEGALDTIADYANKMFMRADDAITHEQAAHAHWNLAQDHNAIEDILMALHDIVSGMKYGALVYDPWWPDGALHYYFSNCIEIPELTMDAIIDAMLVASAAEVQWFVGIADAYRQSIWNRPFDKELFTALARGFELWA